MTDKPKSTRGFASFDPEKLKAVAAKGGSMVPAHKRSFSVDRDLATAAGAKGGGVSRSGGRPKSTGQ